MRCCRARVVPRVGLEGHVLREAPEHEVRRVVREPDEARERGAAARERMRTRYSPEALARDVLEAIAQRGVSAAARAASARRESVAKEEL